ncbi:hypothetical protein PI480_01126 [Lactococcus petauri]|nr:hypothetical protein [Lactococcus petauri]MDC7845250.1 hypothetical protein [Lactococcus petauri]
MTQLQSQLLYLHRKVRHFQTQNVSQFRNLHQSHWHQIQRRIQPVSQHQSLVQLQFLSRFPILFLHQSRAKAQFLIRFQRVFL